MSHEGTAMHQLTVRGFDDELSARLRGLAQREGISLNQAALRLLRKGAGLDDDGRSPGPIGNSLDHLFGVWTQAEYEEFNKAIEEFETIDEEMWK